MYVWGKIYKSGASYIFIDELNISKDLLYKLACAEIRNNIELKTRHKNPLLPTPTKFRRGDYPI